LTVKVVEDIGRSRSQNEDAHLVAPELALFAVADGMGGHAAGEVASRLAVDEVRRSIGGTRSQRAIEAYVREPSLQTRRAVLARLKRAFEHANTRVQAEAQSRPGMVGMGTTLDVAWLARDHAFIGHAGDSRVYLARSRAVLQLTQDHAEIESLKATGVLGAHGRPRGANRLLNAVGLKDTLIVDTLFVDLARGDRLLLCTDGVHGQIDSEGEIGELLRTGSVEDGARALVQRAGAKGRDNATALVVEIADRFVRREVSDRGVRARDIERAKLSPLLIELPISRVMSALAAAVEIELSDGELVPQVVASDLVSYIVLDGLVRCDGDRLVSVGALLFSESLVGVAVRGELPVTENQTRLLRLRADDFTEVCAGDPGLAAELYRRLATHLARSGQSR
jgi:serine/threonine protein phosphatase PrpC